MTEADRVDRNHRMLEQCYSVFRHDVIGILGDLEAWGTRPRIQQAWRSPADQLALYDRHLTKLKWGFHNATGKDKVTPEALAVDFVDDDAPLASPVSFILKLAAAAMRYGCKTGILWGVPGRLQAPINDAITRGDWNAPLPEHSLGWDCLHLQPLGLWAWQARLGLRPK